MPPIPDPTPQQVAASALFLYSLSRRPLASDDENPNVRLARKVLWDLASTSPLAEMIGRKVDFYEAVRQVAEKTLAVMEATAAARRVDVVLARDVTEWEDLYPEAVLERVNARAAELGLDTASPIPDEVRVIPKPRKVDPATVTERTCGRCKETKPVSEFNRRGDGWQRWDRKCQAEAHREWAAANPGYEAERDRSHRYSGERGGGSDRLSIAVPQDTY